MAHIEITEENLAGLQKWAEYFSLPFQKTVDVIIATALIDLQTGSPLFFNALDPLTEEDWQYTMLTPEEARELEESKEELS